MDYKTEFEVTQTKLREIRRFVHEKLRTKAVFMYAKTMNPQHFVNTEDIKTLLGMLDETIK